MNTAVRCPHCDGLSRVPETAIGRGVACPLCSRPFTANPVELAQSPARTIPVVYPIRHIDPDAPMPNSGPKSMLVGLALLPFGVPLLWLLGPLLSGKESFFTFALPVAIAVGFSGLCLGVVLSADWKFSTRIKGIFALLLVGYFLAGSLYFLKIEWIESIRKGFGQGNDNWMKFSPPDKSYAAQVPVEMKADGAELIAGWKLRTFRSAGAVANADIYFLADGPPPDTLKGATDDRFFDEVKKGLTAATNGTLVSEKPASQQNHVCREYVISLADRASTRSVRVYRVRERIFVTAVEGAFLPPDSRDVQKFFVMFYITPSK